jgi:hypothetical protein
MADMKIDPVMQDQLLILQPASVLTLQPGDRLVLKTDAVLSADMANCLRAKMAEFVGDDVPIILLERGMDLGVLRKVSDDGA